VGYAIICHHFSRARCAPARQFLDSSRAFLTASSLLPHRFTASSWLQCISSEFARGSCKYSYASTFFNRLLERLQVNFELSCNLVFPYIALYFLYGCRVASKYLVKISKFQVQIVLNLKFSQVLMSALRAKIICFCSSEFFIFVIVNAVNSMQICYC